MKNKSILHYAILFNIVFLTILPKDFSLFLNVIPTRITAGIILILAALWDYKNKVITFRKDDNFLRIAYILFILFSLFSLLTTENIINTLYTIVKYSIYGVTFDILYRVNFKEKEYENFLWVSLFSMFGVFLYAIINYIFKFNLNMAGIYKYPGAFGRVQSTFFNPIYFGMYINLAMVIILYLINAFKGTPYYIKKWLLNTMFIIATAILALTFTRSAYIVAILNIGLIYLLNFNHLKYLLKKSLIVIILSVIVVLNIPGAYSTMKSAILAYLPKIEESELANDNDISLDEVDASITSRKEFYKAAYNAYNDNKILGVGFGSYEDFMKKDNNTEKYFSTRFGFPHNNYIHILVEAGTIAFIFLMISISIVIKKAFVLYWKSRNYEMMGGIIIANIISLLLIAFYESLTYDSQLFMLEVLFTAIAINYVSSLSNKKTSLYQ